MNADRHSQDTFEYYHMRQDDGGRGIGGIGPALPAVGHALSGGLATAGAKAIVYPLELCITRLQVQRQLRAKGEAQSAAKDADTEYSSVVDAAQKIYRSEGGLQALYTGVGPEVVKGIIDSFLFFLAYNYIRKYEQKKAGSGSLSVVKELGVGVAAGAFAKFITTPIQNIVTRQQTAALVAARDPGSSRSLSESDKLSVREVASHIRSERGIAGFWAGYSESVVLTINPAITFAVDDLLRRLLPRSRREKPSPQLTFLIAALSKAIATTITYPAMLAKSRAQAVSPKNSLAEEEGADTGGPPEMLEKSSTLNATPERQKAKRGAERIWSMFFSQSAMLVSLKKIYHFEGLSGLYAGLEGEVVKGFLQHGLTMMMKENVHAGVIQAYYMLLRLTKRWPTDLEQVKHDASKLATDAQDRVTKAGENVADSARTLVGKS